MDDGMRDEIKIEKEKQLLDKFDGALQQKKITPFFQPVKRFISNAVTTMEALARWDDAELGLLLPDDFIHVLERHHRIRELDLYMLDEVCSMMAKPENISPISVPVGINLSVQDFENYDMTAVIEAVIEKHKVAKDMLYIEIDETAAIGENTELILQLSKLRRNGYKVWIDHFGSGALQFQWLAIYPVDGVKINMKYFDIQDVRSREMLRSCVKNIKNMYLQTLAVGVETQEQYDFLYSVGCDKIEGFFVAPPMSWETTHGYMMQQQFPVERRDEHNYYDDICHNNLITSSASAIVEFDGDDFRILYSNEAFHGLFVSLGMTNPEQLYYMLNSPYSTLSRKFRYLQKRSEENDGYVQMDFSVSGQYFRLSSKLIATNLNCKANHVKAERLSHHDEREKEQSLDYVFRVMYSMYDSIFLLHPDNKMENVMRSNLLKHGRLDERDSGNVVIDLDFVLNFIHPDDRKEYAEWVNYNRLRKTLMKTESGFTTKYFRSSTDQLRYVWKAHTFQYIPDMDWIIYSTKKASLHQPGLAEKINSEYSSNPQENFDKALLQQIKHSKTINFFWKNAQRQILGVSDGFLNTMQIDDGSSLTNRKDEELHWLMNEKAAIADDLDVLKNGTVIYNAADSSIVNGIPRNIATSKEPIYQDGEIIGMLCNFVNIEAVAGNKSIPMDAKKHDLLTGFLSAQGMLDVVTEYIEAMLKYSEKFAVIHLLFQERDQNYAQYGPAISEKISLGVADILKQWAGNDSVLARLYTGNYTILKKYTDAKDITDFVAGLVHHLKYVKEFEGYPVTLYPATDIVYAEENCDKREIISVATGGMELDLLHLQEMEKQVLYWEAIHKAYDFITVTNLTQNTVSILAGQHLFGYDWSKFTKYTDLLHFAMGKNPDMEATKYGYESVELQLERYRNGLRLGDSEHRFCDVDGEMHWVAERVIYSEERVTGDILCIGLTRVIDDMVREREQRKAKLHRALAEARAASKAKSIFLSNMSHDIRTPMNAILGYAAIASGNMDNTQMVQDCVNKILYSGRYLQEIISDVLDMSRIEAGKDGLNLKPMHFDELGAEIMSVVSQLTKEKQIHFTLDTSKVRHRLFIGDHVKQRRIFLNIFSNAVKFTAAGGRIRSRVVEVPGTKPGFSTYIYQVTDNGIGMGEEFLEHIYGMFERERTSTESQMPGTGLGMAIVKKYVDMMGGTIDIKSKQGIGTQVTIKLELEWASEEPAVDEDADSKDLQYLAGRRILAVDDSAINREIVRLMLEGDGMTVETAADGMEAVEALHECEDGYYDCVLMDIKMPVMDGLEATRAIRASERKYLQKVPIVAISANVFTEDILKSMNAGMNAHLGKPFVEADLIKNLVQVISEK